MSVPWSASKPRRKYWFALPPPECCTMTRPGVTRRMSCTLPIGRSWKSRSRTDERRRRADRPLREHEGRLILSRLRDHRRSRWRLDLRREREMKVVREVDRRGERNAAARRRREHERLRRGERRFVEPVTRGRRHARVRHVTALVDGELERDGALHAILQRRFRIHGVGPRDERRRDDDDSLGARILRERGPREEDAERGQCGSHARSAE